MIFRLELCFASAKWDASPPHPLPTLPVTSLVALVSSLFSTTAAAAILKGSRHSFPARNWFCWFWACLYQQGIGHLHWGSKPVFLELVIAPEHASDAHLISGCMCGGCHCLLAQKPASVHVSAIQLIGSSGEIGASSPHSTGHKPITEPQTSFVFQLVCGGLWVMANHEPSGITIFSGHLYSWVLTPTLQSLYQNGFHVFTTRFSFNKRESRCREACSYKLWGLYCSHNCICVFLHFNRWA